MASTKSVTASLVIDFSQAGGEGILTAEIDDRETGYNAGDTSFGIGSEPAFLLFMTSNVVIDRMVSSEGTLVRIASSEAVAAKEWITYANEKSGKPKYPIRAGGTVLDSANIVGTPIITESAVSFAAPQIGVLQLDYTSIAVAYKLVGASGLRPVVIFVAGHTT